MPFGWITTVSAEFWCGDSMAAGAGEADFTEGIGPSVGSLWFITLIGVAVGFGGVAAPDAGFVGAGLGFGALELAVAGGSLGAFGRRSGSLFVASCQLFEQIGDQLLQLTPNRFIRHPRQA